MVRVRRPVRVQFVSRRAVRTKCTVHSQRGRLSGVFIQPPCDGAARAPLTTPEHHWCRPAAVRLNTEAPDSDRVDGRRDEIQTGPSRYK